MDIIKIFIVNGIELQFYKMKRVLKMNDGNGCTIVNVVKATKLYI